MLLLLIRHAQAAQQDEARYPDDTLRPLDLAALGTEIGDIRPDETIALVGHEPWMSELASLLLAGSSGGLAIDFAKSGVMAIQTEGFKAGAGTLVAFLRP